MALAAPRVAPAFKGPPGQEDMPWLLTPGPVTTSRTVKLTMLADWGSGDQEFRQIVASIRKSLLRLANCGPSYECVLLQGPGAFAVEAALGSFCPAVETKTLVIANGVDGEHAAAMIKHLRRRHLKIETRNNAPMAVDDVASLLDSDPAISHVWLVHCETASGIVNPVHDLTRVVKQRGRVVMVDARATFGALPLDMEASGIDVMISSASHCLESIPGLSFVLAKRSLLTKSQGKSHSFVLDLHEQWKNLEAGAEFRFTPPTHALAAFHQALAEHESQGGVEARGARYARSARELVKGMREMGFIAFLGEGGPSPLVQVFLHPRDPNFNFEKFRQGLRHRGFTVYPGALRKRSSFRMGAMGQVEEPVIHGALRAVRQVLRDMNVTDLTPGDA